jgi:hypothetical protein
MMNPAWASVSAQRILSSLESQPPSYATSACLSWFLESYQPFQSATHVILSVQPLNKAQHYIINHI